MGMYGILRRASAADVARLRSDPSLVEPFLFGEPPAMVDAGPRGLLGFLLRLTPIKIQTVSDAQPEGPPRWPEAAEGEELNLDKAWHGLHFLFTGTDDSDEEPACFIIAGGEDIGDDNGDQVPRLLSPAQVRELGDASVPFEFDVHAVIYSEDAPGLENLLHRRFHWRRINRVNERKEFFCVGIEEIVEAVRDHNAVIEIIREAPAAEYRKTQALLADEAARRGPAPEMLPRTGVRYGRRSERRLVADESVGSLEPSMGALPPVPPIAS